MKKLLIVTLVVSAAILPLQYVNAQSVLLTEQYHYYTVQLRSDGKAIVYGRIVFENSKNDTDLDKYEFSLPSGVSADSLTVQQVLAKSNGSQCKTYETPQEYAARLEGKNPENTYESYKKCLVYNTSTYDEDYNYNTHMQNNTDYYYSKYYQTKDTEFDYANLDVKNDNNSYAVSLKETVKPHKQGSVLVSFVASNFVSGGFLGRYT